MGVPHTIIVEEQELADYEAQKTPLATLMVLDPSYRDRHETRDNFGYDRSFGAGPARNQAWDHALSLGFKRHWDVDDNIMGFFRLNHNLKTPVADGTVFRVMEDFVDRYTNVGLAGPNYFMFAPRKAKLAPFVMNTRIYSCTLIRNDLPLRWRLRMNEDTDLSLRVLKSGLCTVQFYAFLQNKATTQTVKGGYNTGDFYADKAGAHEPSHHVHDDSCNGNPNRPCPLTEGWCCEDHLTRSTMWKSQMLVDAHPDVARLAWRFKRWHHFVDYSGFRQKLELREGLTIAPETDNFGMILERLDQSQDVWRQVATPWDELPVGRVDATV
jgi:hypothetical protein